MTDLGTDIECVHFTDTRDGGTAHVHITVSEGGEWIGDFFAEFSRQPHLGEYTFVADWSDLRRGNGLYVDEDPPFWPVEEAAEELDDRYDGRRFEAINSGPNDI